MEVILASSNEHKAQEFSDLFNSKTISVIPAVEKIEVLEDGKSYLENAEKKARAYFEKYKVPVLSDDSGINIEALPDELGIYSARFGGENLNFNERMDLVLEKLDKAVNRKSCFICVLCFYLSHDEVYFFEGRMDGEILKEKKGIHGFGYDPIFSPLKHDSDKSLAELPEWKEQNSHRAQAAQKAQLFFRERVCQS